MSRTTNYYFDYTDKASGHRKRWWYRAAYGGTRTTAGVPGFQEDPGDGSTWRRVPDGFMKGLTTGSYEYDDLPLGTPDPPTKTFRVDLSLPGNNADPELQALPGYILYPRQQSAAGMLVTSSLSSTREYNAYGIVVVLTDRGDASVTVDAFAVEFYGAHVPDDEAKLEYNRTSGECIHEFQALDITRVVLQELIPGDLSLHMLNAGYTTDTTNMIYNVYYNHDGVTYTRVFGSPPTDDPRQIFTLYRMEDLWTGVAFLATQMLRLQTGDTTLTWQFLVPTGMSGGVGTMAGLALYEPDYTRSNAPNPTGLHDETTARIIGTVALSDHPDAVLGGYLSEDDETGTGLYRYETLWVWLRDLVEGAAEKGRIVESQAGVVFYTYPTEMRAFLNRLDVAPDSGAVVDIGLRQGVVPGAEYEMPGATGLDISPNKVRIWGTEDDSLRTIPVVWATHPVVGEKGDVWLMQSTTGFNGDIDGWVMVAGTYNCPTNLLVYYGTPPNANYSIPIVYSHYVGVRRSADPDDIATPCIGGQDYWPTPTLSPLTDPGSASATYELYRQVIEEYLQGNFWIPLRVMMIKAQKEGGIAYAATSVVADLWSRLGQYGITMTVPYQYALVRDLGTWTNLDIVSLLPSYVPVRGGDPTIVSITPDDDTAMAEVVLIAPGEVE